MSDDADLEQLATDRLLAEVTDLSAQIDDADARLTALRVRRTRAFRVLRDRSVTRVVIAQAAGVTEGAIRNLISDLEKREARLT